MTADVHSTRTWQDRPRGRTDVAISMLPGVRDFLRRRWVVVGLVTVLVILAATVALHLVTPRFRAHADILLDPQREKVFGPTDAPAPSAVDASSVESAVALIKGNALLRDVARSEHLVDDPAFDGGQQSGVLWRAVRAAFGGPTLRVAPSETRAIGALFRALRVERVGKSAVISISVTTTDPAIAARLTNAIAEGFVRDQRDALLESVRREAAFFAERLGPLSDQLRRSEEALDRFRKEHDLVARGHALQGSDAQATISEQQLVGLNEKLATARTGTAEAWAKFDEARGATAHNGSLEAIPDVVRSNLIGELRRQQAEVARKEADLSARYSEGFPLLINARAERREIERAIAREMARIVANLRGTYDIAKSQEDGLRASIAEIVSAAGLDSDLARQLRELERVKLVDQTVFETYLARAKSVQQQAAFEQHDVRIISPAMEPSVPAFPQTTLTLFCAVLLGLGSGVGVALALDALDPGFRAAEDVEAFTGQPVLGTIPWLGRRQRTVEGRLVDPARLLVERPGSAYSETVHEIRAGLRLQPAAAGHLLLISSAEAGAGKSTVALSLAVSAARSGRRVLLLDADLRNPSLSRSFGFEHRLGLVDMLSGIVGTDQTTVPLGAGLWILPAGRKAATPPDLFASSRMATYLTHVRSIYDLVVIDAAPAEAVVDASVLAEQCDKVLVVIAWRSTPRAAVRRCVRRFGAQKLGGLVLNKATLGAHAYGRPFGVFQQLRSGLRWSA